MVFETRWPHAKAAFFYLLVLIAVFWPFLFFGKTFLPTDLYLMLYKPFAAAFPQFRPHNHFDDDILKYCYLYQWGAREFLYRPYWIGEVFGGYAPYANTYASHFSPLNWILRLGPLEFTYPLKLLVSLWIAGISLFSLAYSWTKSFSASWISGLGFLLSSLFVTMLLRWWIPGAFSWFPLVLLFSQRAIERKEAGLFLAAGFFLAASFLDGFFQTSASLLLAYGVFLLVSCCTIEGPRGCLRAVGGGALAVLFALFLSAIMWVPQLEYFWWDMAKGASRSAGLYFEKNWWQRLLSLPLLIAAFFPQGLGSPRTLDVAKIVKSHLQDFSLFIGTLPLLAAIAFLPSAWRGVRSRAALFLLAIGLFIPVFTPLDRYLYFRFLAVYILGACILAAFGFDSIFRRPGMPAWGRVLTWGWALWAAIGCAAFSVFLVRALSPGWLEELMRGVIASRVGETTIGSRNPEWLFGRGQAFLDYWSFGSADFNWAFVLTGLALLVGWALHREWFRPRLAVVMVAAVTFLQLNLFVGYWFSFKDLREFPIFPPNELADRLRELDPKSEFRSIVNDFNGERDRELQIVPSNTNFFYGFNRLDGFDGVRPGVIYDVNAPLDRYDLLGRLNVKYILTSGRPALSSADLRRVSDGPVSIYENLAAQPRARVFFDYQLMDSTAIRSSLQAEGMPDRTALVEEQLSFRPQSIAPENSVELIAQERNAIRYSVNSSRPGLLVSTESYFPGWKAFYEGREVHLRRVNYYMRGVEVPAGKGEIEFRFQPASYRYGAWISFITAVAGLLFLALALRGRLRSV